MTKEDVMKIINEHLMLNMDDTPFCSENAAMKILTGVQFEISTAIAEHERSQWKEYPENKPEKVGHYLVVLSDDMKTITKLYYRGLGFDYFDELVIAFRELPKYEPKTEKP